MSGDRLVARYATSGSRYAVSGENTASWVRFGRPGARGWPWVKNRWFRLGHFLAIGVVVAQAWQGALCPLTTLEMVLRSRAGDAVYSGSFIAHWMEALLYHEAPPWVFATGYTVFGLLVVASWFIVRPRPLARRGQPDRARDAV